MHCNSIRVINAKDVKTAVAHIENDLDMDESLTSDNWWNAIGVLNLNTKEYTKIAKDRDDQRLHTIGGIKEVVQEIASKERYERLQLDMMCAIKQEDWDTVRINALELDDIKHIVKNGFKFSAKEITELAPCRIDTFSITDMTDRDSKEDTFAVILDFHY